MKIITHFVDRVTYVAVIPEPETSGDRILFEGLIGEGMARCMPTDVFNETVGQGIALGRAFQDLGIKVEALWRALVVTEEEHARVLLNDLLALLNTHDE